MKIERYTPNGRISRKPLVNSEINPGSSIQSQIDSETGKRKNMTFYTKDLDRVTLSGEEIEWLYARFTH